MTTFCAPLSITYYRKLRKCKFANVWPPTRHYRKKIEIFFNYNIIVNTTNTMAETETGRTLFRTTKNIENMDTIVEHYNKT